MVQPYVAIEPLVMVAPSNVSGLGVYTTRPVNEGDVLCLYSGQCVKCVEGNSSNYLLQGKWKNPVTRKKEVWYIDSTNPYNTSGRLINDAKGTEYENNVGYAEAIKGPHGVTGNWYMEIKALFDIPGCTELLADYGELYWSRYARYHKFQDPMILTNAQYEERMLEYAERR